MSGLNARLDELRIVGKLADLKESQYNNTLLLHAIMTLLLEKQVLTPDELSAKLIEIDRASLPTPRSDHPNA